MVGLCILCKQLFSSRECFFVMSHQVKTNKVIIRIAIFMAVVGLAAMDLYLPSLPAIAHTMGASTLLAQSTLSAFLLSFASSQFFSGVFSDRYGRKPVLLLGISVFCLGGMLTLFARNIDMLILARYIQGAGIGAAVSLARIVMRDRFSGADLAKAFTYMGCTVSFTPAVAPFVGGLLESHFGYMSNFAVILGSGLVLLMLVICYLPETHHTVLPDAVRFTRIKQNMATLFAHDVFISSIIYAALSFSIVVAYSTVNPFLFQVVLAFSPTQYGFITLFIATGMVFSFFLNTYFVSILGALQLIKSGLLLLLLSGVALLIPAVLGWLNCYVVAVPVFFATLAIGFIMPNAGARAFHPFPQMIGFVGAVYGFIQVSISALVGLLVSLMPADNQFGMAYIFIMLALVGLSVMRREQRLSQDAVAAVSAG